MSTKYNISYYEMLEAPIIVKMTTYPSHENSVIKMLNQFKKQTMKPDLITVWLSNTEYPKDIIPQYLKMLFDEDYIELNWTPINS